MGFQHITCTSLCHWVFSGIKTLILLIWTNHSSLARLTIGGNRGLVRYAAIDGAVAPPRRADRQQVDVHRGRARVALTLRRRASAEKLRCQSSGWTIDPWKLKNKQNQKQMKLPAPLSLNFAFLFHLRGIESISFCCSIMWRRDMWNF